MGTNASTGYTKAWIASELGVSEKTIESWITKGLLRPHAPGRGNKYYSSEFVAAARCVHQWLQLNYRGPLAHLRDQMHPAPEEEDAA
jgi:DNA-binding transcriptional MerR regulator